MRVVRTSSMVEPVKSEENDNAGVIAPPPIIFLAVLALAYGFGWILGDIGFGLSVEPRVIAGGILIVAGLAMILVAGAQMRFARTHIEPWKPTTAIVTNGIFDYSRNPIYLGMALGYAGLTICLNSVVALAGLPLALLIMHYGVIKREERYLEAKFGEPYRRYKEKVRRWI